MLLGTHHIVKEGVKEMVHHDDIAIDTEREKE